MAGEPSRQHHPCRGRLVADITGSGMRSNGACGQGPVRLLTTPYAANMRTAVDDEPFLTLATVALQVGVSELEIYRLVQAGSLPAVNIPSRGHWLIHADALKEWLDAGGVDLR